MKLFDKKSLILLISVVSINLLCIVSVSYAYFTANIKGNEDAQEMKVQAGTMEITYTDSNEVSLNNTLPGDSVTKQFKVENTGTLDTKYNIKIDINTNDFEDYSDLEYILTKNGTPQEKQVLPYVDGYISINNEIKSTAIDTYSLKVMFKNDTVDINQNDNANKKVDFTIEVDSNDEVKLYEYKEPYKDNSGANRPKLYQGMIPIRFTEENTMVIADITSKWYDYDQHEWGNAVLIDNTNQDIVNKFYNEDGTLKINDPITEEDILQMYVWIPRYKYQLFNAVAGETSEPQMINIKFERGVTSTGSVSCTYTDMMNGTIQEDCKNAINGNWYTHPAFTFGETELPGIWVGKFEPSDSHDKNGRTNNVINEITILPNKTSMVTKTVSTMFNAERNIKKIGNKYNLNPNQIDTHMAKNIEWGAVAYLTSSKYGIYSSDGQSCMIDASMNKENCEVWINNSAQGAGTTGVADTWGGTHTGCVADSVSAPVIWNQDTTQPAKCDEDKVWNKGGIKASTTGNVYGIYDMAGGAWEYTMGVIKTQDGKDIYYALSEFNKDNMPDSKYYDLYGFSTSNTTHERGHLGDSIRETLVTFRNITGGWNTDYVNIPYVDSSEVYPWFVRGGCYTDTILAGIFASHRNSGEALMSGTISFRSVLSAA